MSSSQTPILKNRIQQYKSIEVKLKCNEIDRIADEMLG